MGRVVAHNRSRRPARRRAKVPSLGVPGLRYVNAHEPGLSRRRHGRGFAYRDSDGRPLRDRRTLRRIRSLAIPPAWREVWICADERGHIQATGRDARGRKQYRYHPLWRAFRDEAKFERTIDFAEGLPRLRRRITRDLASDQLSRRMVVAAVIRLLELTLLRVGNEEYARENRSFGLTTLRNRHARVRGRRFELCFRGKGGRRHEVDLEDRRLARIVRQCQDLPGQRLFQYLDESGEPQAIASDDVNEYLREAMGQEFSAKDFRTWAGTVLALQALLSQADQAGDSAKSRLLRAVEDVAGKLGNTPAVCRRCYIHPAIIEAQLDDEISGAAERAAARGDGEPRSGLRNGERLVLELLRSRLAQRRASAQDAA
jgi:DNA topoisomerase I